MFDTLKALVTGSARKVQHKIEDENIEMLMDEGYEQEKKHLREFKVKVSELDAELTTQKKQLEAATKQYNEAQDSAAALLEAGDEANAIKLLDKIEGELTIKVEGLTQNVNTLQASVNEAIAAVTQKERDIESMRLEVEQTKTKARLNKLNSSISTSAINTDNASVRRKEALERMKKRTDAKAEQLASSEKLFGKNQEDSVENLIKKGKSTGTSSATSAADRLKNLQKK
tara:strand:- start:46688 stop:47374 length:687 start_codon:yes stop_codon:yes gene_type:complete